MMYKFFTDNEKNVWCVSTYAGKTVRGVAKCHNGDVFDFETGKKIAQARCDMKIAEKRHARAMRKSVEALQDVYKAQEHYAKMTSYCTDSLDALMGAKEMYDNLMAGLTNK